MSEAERITLAVALGTILASVTAALSYMAGMPHVWPGAALCFGLTVISYLRQTRRR